MHFIFESMVLHFLTQNIVLIFSDYITSAKDNGGYVFISRQLICLGSLRSQSNFLLIILCTFKGIQISCFLLNFILGFVSFLNVFLFSAPPLKLMLQPFKLPLFFFFFLLQLHSNFKHIPSFYSVSQQ